MVGNRMWNYMRYGLLVLASCGLLSAAEHRGLVKFGGLPVPGATVIATQGDKSVTAVTDPQGAYTFKELADGNWIIKVEMLCFSPMEREIVVAPNAPSPEWELKLLPFDEIKASAPPPPPSTPAPAVTSSSNGSAPAKTETATVAAAAPKPTSKKAPKLPKGVAPP